jgi:SAM-dependent methyltransferase
MSKDKPSKVDFDDYAESYRHQIASALPAGGGDVDAFTRIKVWHLARAIARTFPGRRDLAILDAGCGIGITDSYLKLAYPMISGFDISAKSIELAARANPELSYHYHPDGMLPFAPESFDVAFAICVVHHIPPAKWSGFFRQLHRVMKPGGLLAIYEHNPWNPATRRIVSRCEFDRDAVLLSSRECRLTAEAAGFSAPATRNILFLPFEGEAWCRWEDRFLSSLPIGAQYELTARK